jgi:ligand-binding sensor domain-containing protein
MLKRSSPGLFLPLFAALTMAGCGSQPAADDPGFLSRSPGRFLEEVRLPEPATRAPIYGSTMQGKGQPAWLASEKGLYRYARDGTWTRFGKSNGLPSDLTRAVAFDSRGRPWCGTAEGPAFRDGETWRRVLHADGKPLTAQTWVINHEETQSWLATDEGLVKASPDGKVLEQWNLKNSPLPENWVYAAVADGKGGAWAAVWLGGLWHYDGRRWTGYTDPDGKLDEDLAPDDGLLSDGCTSCTMDSENRVWVGTTAGVSRFDGSKWKDMYLGPVNYVEPARDGKSIIVCAPDGVLVFEGDLFRRYYLDAADFPAGSVSGFGSATARTAGRLASEETFTAAADFPVIFVGTRLGLSVLEVGP